MIRKALAAGLGLACTALLAGPPYLTDDPEPVDLHRWEAYLFTSGQTFQGGPGSQYYLGLRGKS